MLKIEKTQFLQFLKWRRCLLRKVIHILQTLFRVTNFVDFITLFGFYDKDLRIKSSVSVFSFGHILYKFQLFKKI